ncbi:insulinase family protein [Sphingomonas rosea]|uniref:Insulinase family protein n=1 Tax=Sphingomonas rosea TaxID=335605 RepID=A0ABP7U8D3_9SPHN
MQGAGLKADPQLRIGTLSNGMRYVIRVNKTPPKEASLRLRIDSGSLNEADDQRGLAHFLEHMVLNGTENVPEGDFVRRLERHGLRFGPDTNASTDFGQTVFKLDLPSTDKATLDEAFFLLREVAGRAKLDAAAVDRERGIVLSEERARASAAYRQSIDQLGWLYAGQRLPSRLPIGTTEVISTAPRQRLLDYYRAWYRPERATLVVVGDVDPADIKARLEAQFGDWRGVGPAGKPADEGQPQARPSAARLFVDPAVGASFNATWIRPADRSPDSVEKRRRDLEEQIAAAVLNRRLEKLAQQDGKPPFVGARSGVSDIEQTAETTSIGAQARIGEWRGSVVAVEQEQRRLVQYGVTPDELERELTGARAALEASVAAASTRTTPALAESLVAAVNRDTVVTSPEDRVAFYRSIEPSLTPERIHAAARRMFTGSGPLLYLSTPRPAATEAQLLAAWQESTRVALNPPTAQAKVAWPYDSFGAPGQVVEKREIAAIGTTLVRFANGVRLTVRPSSSRKEQVLVSVRFGNGRLAMSRDRTSPEWALAQGLILGGTGKLDADSVNRALTGKLVGASLGIEDERFVLGGGTRPADFATEMQLLAAYLTDAAWRPLGWERARATSASIHDRLESTPGGVLTRDLGYILRSGDRRWALPDRVAMRTSSIAQGRALLEPALKDGTIEVIVVGDIGVDQAIAETARTFGALAPRAAAAAEAGPMRFPAPPAEPITLFHKGREDQAMGFMAWPTTGYSQATRREARLLTLLGAVFQLRITDQLREKEGVSYSPSAGHAASATWANYGYLAAQIEAPPAKLDSFFTEAQAIAADLAAKPIDADELNRARLPLLSASTRARDGNSFWLNALEEVGTKPFVVESITSQLVDYQAVTPAMLQDAAKRYLRAGAALRIKVVKGGSAPRLLTVPAIKGPKPVTDKD